MVKVVVNSKKFSSLISKLKIKSYFIIKEVCCIYSRIPSIQFSFALSYRDRVIN